MTNNPAHFNQPTPYQKIRPLDFVPKNPDPVPTGVRIALHGLLSFAAFTPITPPKTNRRNQQHHPLQSQPPPTERKPHNHRPNTKTHQHRGDCRAASVQPLTDHPRTHMPPWVRARTGVLVAGAGAVRAASRGRGGAAWRTGAAALGLPARGWADTGRAARSRHTRHALPAGHSFPLRKQPGDQRLLRLPMLLSSKGLATDGRRLAAFQPKLVGYSRQ